MRTPHLIILILLFSGIILAYIVLNTSPKDEKIMESSDSSEFLALGKDIYEDNCADCHGLSGKGDGKEAHRLKQKPQDFTSGTFKFRSTPTGSLPTDEDIYRSITEGIRGTAMLGQIHLSEKKRRLLVDYIKTFSSNFSEDIPQPEIAITAPHEKTDSLIAYGKWLYEEAGCWNCHGNSGIGDGPSADTLRNVDNNPVVMPDLTLRPLKRANSNEELYRTLVTGLDGTPMPSFEDALNDTQRWALVYYLEDMAIGNRSSVQPMTSMNMMQGMMCRMMDLVGEEYLGMMIDMPAARARMQSRMLGNRMGMKRNNLFKQKI